MSLAFEQSPWPTPTLIVSLEAIFLSTFVMSGQNRPSSFQQAKADAEDADVSRLLVENTELTRTIAQLTTELHRHPIQDVFETDRPGLAPWVWGCALRHHQHSHTRWTEPRGAAHRLSQLLRIYLNVRMMSWI